MRTRLLHGRVVGSKPARPNNVSLPVLWSETFRVCRQTHALTSQGSVMSMYFSTFINCSHSANFEAISSGISPCSARRASASDVK